MDFLDRLKRMMEKHNDNNSSLAKKSGIPYTTIVGLFKRGWETAQLTTIQKICEYYSVSIDYMVYGVSKLSEDALMFAATFEMLDDHGKELLNVVADLQVKRMKGMPKIKSVPHITGGHDSDMFAWYNAKREVEELEKESEETEEKPV